jgi:hypothetical protein
MLNFEFKHNILTLLIKMQTIKNDFKVTNLFFQNIKLLYFVCISQISPFDRL